MLSNCSKCNKQLTFSQRVILNGGVTGDGKEICRECFGKVLKLQPAVKLKYKTFPEVEEIINRANIYTPPNNNNSKKIGVVAAVASIFFLVFVLKGGFEKEDKEPASTTPAYVPPPPLPSNTEAYIMGQTFVKQMLVSPASAEFPYSDEAQVVKYGDSVYAIKSFVDSQNGFGAMLRSDYIIKIKYMGNDRWRLLEKALETRM